MNGEYFVLKTLAVTAACNINDQHNEKMLREGRYIPWWKRHLLLCICLAMMSPVLIVGVFIVLGNALPMSFWGALGTFLGWAIPIGGGLAIFLGYRRAERRWRRESNKPTTVVRARR